ncbi:odorant receptor 131-2-like [Huso huso]|uniref:Odorant receptor 131-2-like n=1 Tax=Huso huso TaxID=61971 RepID=A0ABR0ZN73_HUSHU
MNSSTGANATSLSAISLIEHGTIQLQLALILGLSSFFLYINMVMILIFFKEPVYRDSSRYVLFIHMLFNDTLQSLISVFLYFLVVFRIQFNITLCTFFVHLGGNAAMNTPFNLAVMSLDRYIAICFPLRYSEISSVSRAYLAIGVTWLIGSVPSGSDIFIVLTKLPLSYFNQKALCSRAVLIQNSDQQLKQAVFNGLYFTVVWIAIFYTYVQIVLQARKVRAPGSQASKAQKTVLLHSVQLLLSMAFFLNPLTEYIFQYTAPMVFAHVRYVNFFLTSVLPKFLSPLIYGLRDDNLKKHLRLYLKCNFNKVNPAAVHC